METVSRSPLRFPCDCLSSDAGCAESWARVAKEGMFKNGSREKMLNLLHSRPRTIAQLAAAARLSQPTVFRHLKHLLKCGLVRELQQEGKNYSFERYYVPNFPVVSRGDRIVFEKDIAALARSVAEVIEKGLRSSEIRFGATDLHREGWAYGVFANYLFHEVQRKARLALEDKGIITTKMKKADLDFIFWAQQ